MTIPKKLANVLLMKTKYLAIISAACLASCGDGQLTEKIESKDLKVVQIGNVPVEIRTIVLDGKEYYATNTSNGQFGLCPKQ